ncbi:hypothetical protein PTTG_06360 [Puccinia triticina 1-1 BBBD Race 1]|uniref:Retrotransposon gag domain-containing protein n=1 Tax=Puccinia triticina (isolate 1-1 / race 1 (BBBD)) TaxID=630390 RepID=A0A180GCS9_PUCT1|nr:hypothetical protein PTTG_06360 [Puccinia triticina 1-1 BBBD Race 1]
MLTLQQTNLDAQRAADARALAAQEAAEAHARADTERFRLAQEAAEEQARANKERFARLQETLIHATTQQTAPPCPASPPNDHVDLPKFRTLDGPTYVGPYQETEAFLAWIQALEIFFNTKKVTATDNKIRIAGTLIKETNLLLVYSNEAKKYLEKPWNDFKQTLFNAALPVRWRQGLKEKIQSLKMDASETFAQYETRARTLQRMINYDSDPLKISDLSLAKWLSSGLSAEVRADILKFEILKTSPRARGKVKFPPSYVTPPKPPNYTAPLPWSSANGPSPRPPNATAGQPILQPAGVAGVLDKPADLYSSMTVTSTAAINKLDDIVARGYDDDEELVTEDNEAAAIQMFEATNAFDKSLNTLISNSILGPTEGYVCNPPKPHKTLHLLHKGRGLQGHIFTVKNPRPIATHPNSRFHPMMPHLPFHTPKPTHLIAAHTPTQFPILYSFEEYPTVSRFSTNLQTHRKYHKRYHKPPSSAVLSPASPASPSLAGKY